MQKKMYTNHRPTLWCEFPHHTPFLLTTNTHPKWRAKSNANRWLNAATEARSVYWVKRTARNRERPRRESIRTTGIWIIKNGNNWTRRSRSWKKKSFRIGRTRRRLWKWKERRKSWNDCERRWAWKWTRRINFGERETKEMCCCCCKRMCRRRKRSSKTHLMY